MKIGTIDNKTMNVHVYDGVDIDLLRTHPKDGSNGFLLIFLTTDQFNNLDKTLNREKCIDLIQGIELPGDFYKLSKLNNDYIAIYHSNYENHQKLEIAEQMFKRSMIRKKFLVPEWQAPINFKSYENDVYHMGRHI